MMERDKFRIIVVTDHLLEERGYGGLEVTQKNLAERAPDDIEMQFLSIDMFSDPQHPIVMLPSTVGPSSSPPFPSAETVKARTDRADLVLFTNVARWPRELLTAVTEDVPYAKYEFDYGFCKTHLKNCEDGCASCVADGWYKEFLQGAERVIFVSPAQKDWYRKILGTVADNSVLIPSWIDPNRFPNLGWKRTPNTVMYHGRLFPHKGVLNVAVQALHDPSRRYTFVGDGPAEVEYMIESVRNCHIIRHATPDLIPYLLNATEIWMSLSQWDDTGPMSAIEAYLCGAKIYQNGRLGYFSYPWDWDHPEAVRTELEQIAPRFWSEMRRILEELS